MTMVIEAGVVEEVVVFRKEADVKGVKVDASPTGWFQAGSQVTARSRVH